MASLYEAWSRGRERGAERAKQSQLAELLSPAAQGDESAQAKLFGVDPQAAIQAGAYADSRRAAAEDRFGKLSTAFAQTRDPAIYQQWRQAAQGVLGPSAAPMPESLDNPNDLDGAIKAATTFAQAYGGGLPKAEEYTLSPGSKRYRGDKLIAEAPAAPPPFRGTWDSARAMWIPEPGGDVTYGGPTSNPITGADFGIGETNNYVRSILSRAQVDANATPEQQAEALLPHLIQQESGGNQNAVSPKGAQGLTQVMPATGRAPGFGVSPLRDGSPQENVRFGRDYLTAMLKRYPGRPELALAAYNAGPGVADRFAGGQASRGGLAGIPVAGVAPKADEAPKPSEFERKLAIAKAMGASDDQLRQMVLGESGGGKPSATQIKLANTAKQKLIDLRAMDDQLTKVEDAFKPLQDSFSAGPGGGILPSVDGKRFDAAVALLKGMARKLTRTPGEGAMSDYESKLAELANPSRGEYEQVTADQIQQLRALVKTTREGYEALLQDAGGSTDNLPGNSGVPQPGTVEAGYRFRGGNPADQNNWERI